MSSTKTYTLPTTGNWTAVAVDSTGTYEDSETSNRVSNATRVSVNMEALSGWAGISAGSHTLTIKAKATGYITSDASDATTFTKTITYSISPDIDENVTAASSNPSTITTGTTVDLVYTTTDSYNLPDTVTVTGADATWVVEDI